MYHLSEYEKEVPASRELFETYFLTIRYLRKEATYGKKYAREKKKLSFSKIKQGNACTFIYNVAKI